MGINYMNTEELVAQLHIAESKLRDSGHLITHLTDNVEIAGLKNFLNAPDSRGNDDYQTSMAGSALGAILAQMKYLEVVSKSTISENSLKQSTDIPGHAELANVFNTILEILPPAFKAMDIEDQVNRAQIIAGYAGYQLNRIIDLGAGNLLTLPSYQRKELVDAVLPYRPVDTKQRNGVGCAPAIETLITTGCTPENAPEQEKPKIDTIDDIKKYLRVVQKRLEISGHAIVDLNDKLQIAGLSNFLNAPNSRSNYHYQTGMAGQAIGAIIAQKTYLEIISQSQTADSKAKIYGLDELTAVYDRLIELLPPAIQTINDNDRQQCVEIIAAHAGHKIDNTRKYRTKALPSTEQQLMTEALLPYTTPPAEPYISGSQVARAPGVETLITTGLTLEQIQLRQQEEINQKNEQIKQQEAEQAAKFVSECEIVSGPYGKPGAEGKNGYKTIRVVLPAVGEDIENADNPRTKKAIETAVKLLTIANPDSSVKALGYTGAVDVIVPSDAPKTPLEERYDEKFGGYLTKFLEQERAKEARSVQR